MEKEIIEKINEIMRCVIDLYFDKKITLNEFYTLQFKITKINEMIKER